MPRLLIFLLITLITLPFGCKKYPDDDYWITLRSPINRIKGAKRMISAVDHGDGFNILAAYREKFGSFYFDFTDEKLKGTGGYLMNIVDSTTNKLICIGYWKFGINQINKNDLYLCIDESIDEGSCINFIDDTLADRMSFNGGILKLTKEEIITERAHFIAYEP